MSNKRCNIPKSKRTWWDENNSPISDDQAVRNYNIFLSINENCKIVKFVKFMTNQSKLVQLNATHPFQV